jgi:hypothetical protein
VLVAPTQVEVFDYYDGGRHSAYPLPLGWEPDPNRTRATLQEIAAKHDDVFGILWAVDERDPERTVEGWLNRHLHKVSDEWFGDVRLARWSAAVAPWEESELPSETVFGDQIALAALGHTRSPVEAGSVLALEAVWRPVRDPDADYTVFVQLLDDENRVVAQRDMWPVGGTAPTSAWTDGAAPVTDRIGLYVPEGTPAGTYRLIVGLYDGATGVRLPLTVDDDADPTRTADNALVLEPVVVQ